MKWSLYTPFDVWFVQTFVFVELVELGCFAFIRNAVRVQIETDCVC